MKSGGKTVGGGDLKVEPGGNPILKRVFTGAAESIIRRGTVQPIRRSYQRLLDAGTKPTLTRLTLAVLDTPLVRGRIVEDSRQCKT